MVELVEANVQITLILNFFKKSSKFRAVQYSHYTSSQDILLV